MTMPTTGNYGKLVDALRQEASAFAAADDKATELAASRRALRAVLQYLRCDAEILNGNLVRPLAVLASDAWDAGQGATVKRLERAPERPGPPIGLARETVQGMLAYVTELMVATRVGEQRALNWVAAEARRYNITDENRQPITSGQLKTWRSQIRRGKAPDEAIKVYSNCKALPIAGGGSCDDLWQALNRARPKPAAALVENAKAAAKNLVLATREAAPMSAPKQTARAKNNTAAAV